MPVELIIGIADVAIHFAIFTWLKSEVSAIFTN